MPSTMISRIDGLTTSVAVKPPIKIMTSAPITLYGEQTINAVTPDGTAVSSVVLDGDRVGVNGQVDQKDNGIYVVRTTAWTRAKDFDGALDAVLGTLVTDSIPLIWRLTTPLPVLFGTSNITFETEDGFNQGNLADLADAVDPAKGAAMIGWNGGTVAGRLGAYIVVTDGKYGAVQDGVTDNTAAVIAAAQNVGVRGAVFIPPNVKFDTNAVKDSPLVPAECVFYDMSGINGGYNKDKLIGIFANEAGDSTTDTTVLVSSGHNPGIALDNTGKAGTPSAQTRIGVLAWTGGQMSKGAIPGLIRSGARLEFGRSSVDSDRWAVVIRKRAPMEAISANYNRWAASMTVGAGEFVFHANRFYKTTVGGVTGVTAPTHTSGTVSDGGVDWTYFQFSYDSGSFYVDDLGRIAANTAPQANQFQRWRQSPDDTNLMLIQYEPLGVSKNVTFRGRPTNSGGTAVTTIPDLRITELGWEFLSSLGSSVGRFSNEGFTQTCRIEPRPNAADGDTTPTVLNRAGLTLANTTATSITTLDDGVTDQVVTLITSNGNTTLVNGAGLKLQGSTNFAMTTALTSITLQKTALSSAWIELCRSVK